jgi:hypothetical protein
MHEKMNFDANTRKPIFSIKSFSVPENITLEDNKDIYIVYETGQAVSDEYYFLKDISFEKPEFEVNSSMYCEYCNLK